MRGRCSSVSKLLDKYFDQEATDREKSLVEDHLAGCSDCRNTLRSMAAFKELLEVPVEAAVRTEDFQRVWQNVNREIAIRKRPSWQESIRSWLELQPIFRKRFWIPALAAAAVLVFLTTQAFFQETSSYVGLPDVEYVDSKYTVMVYPMEKSKMTVIWLFEGQEELPPT